MIVDTPSASYIHPEQFQDTLSTANTIYDVLHDARAAKTICPFRHTFLDALGNYTDTNSLHKFDKILINDQIENILSDTDVDTMYNRCMVDGTLSEDLMRDIHDMLNQNGIDVPTDDLRMPVCDFVINVQDCMYDPEFFESFSGDIWENAYHECTKYMHLATNDYMILGDITPERRLEECMVGFKLMADAHQELGLDAPPGKNTYSDTYQACNACHTLYDPVVMIAAEEGVNEINSIMNQLDGLVTSSNDSDSLRENCGSGVLMDIVGKTDACQVVLPDNKRTKCNDLVGFMSYEWIDYTMAMYAKENGGLFAYDMMMME